VNTVTAYMVKPRGNGYGKWMSKILEAYIPFIFISLTLTLTVMSTAPRVLADTPLRGGSVAGGNISIIVIPVAFKNLEGSVSLETIERRVFVELNDYFQQVSYSRLKVTGDVAPGWYRLSKPVEWYGEGVERWESLVYDAVRAADHDVNYRDYSFIMIVHAGDDESRSLNKTDITSFGTHGRAILQTLDGQLPFGVSCLAERDPLGPYAHYLALNLGLPYLHDNWWEVGEWDLMAHGFWAANGSLPVHPTSVAKVKVGWLSEDNVAQVGLGEKKDVKVAFLEEKPSGVAAVKIPVGEHEYFMVEARAKRGFDAALPDEGVLVLYVNEAANRRKGVYKVVDMRPETETLDDAALKVGEWYVNQTAQLAVKVVSQLGDGCEIVVDRSNATAEASITVETSIPQLEVTVDGKTLVTDEHGSVSKPVAPGDHVVKVPEKVEYGNGTALILQGWVDGQIGAERTVHVESAVKLSAIYRTSYLVQVESPYGNPEGGGWVPAGEKTRITVQREVDQGNGVKQVFKEWSTGERSNEVEVTVNGPLKLTASWDTWLRITLEVQGLPKELNLTVKMSEQGGQGEELTLTPQSQVERWAPFGARVEFQLPESAQGDGRRFKLDRVEDEHGARVEASITLEKPVKLTAYYVPANATGEGPQTSTQTPTPTPNSETQISNPIEAFLRWLLEAAYKAKTAAEGG